MADRNPLPWFKYDVSLLNEELGDVSDAGAGAFHRIVRRLWTRGPQSIEEIERLARESWTEIRHFFAPQQSLFSVPWLEEARTFGERRREQRAEAGRSSAAKRPLKNRSTKSKRPSNEREASVERPIYISPVTSISLSSSTSESSSEEVQEEVHAPTIWPTFLDFYDLYDKRRHRPDAEVEWAKIQQADREAIMAALPAYTRNNTKQYRLDPERYLKKKAWLDEVIERNTPTNGKYNGDAEYVRQVAYELERHQANRAGEGTGGTEDSPVDPNDQ